MKLEEALKMSKFSSQKQKAGLNILYTAWWLKTLIGKELKEIGLTNEQFNVMRILKGMHPEKMCVKDIGSRMIERNSNVPRIIDKLVSKKFVVRSNSIIDKRETVIILSDAGINLLEKANQRVEAIIKKNVQINEEEASHLNTLLEVARKLE